MKKIRLGLEELRVESFAVLPDGRGAAGTVRALADAEPAKDQTWEDTVCNPLPGICTCVESCDPTCEWLSNCNSVCVNCPPKNADAAAPAGA